MKQSFRAFSYCLYIILKLTERVPAKMEIKFFLLPKTTPKSTKQWLLIHWTWSNKGQWSLKGRNQRMWALKVPKLTTRRKPPRETQAELGSLPSLLELIRQYKKSGETKKIKFHGSEYVGGKGWPEKAPEIYKGTPPWSCTNQGMPVSKIPESKERITWKVRGNNLHTRNSSCL